MSLVIFPKTFLGPPCAVNPELVISVTCDGGEYTVIQLPDNTSIPVKANVEEVIMKLSTGAIILPK